MWQTQSMTLHGYNGNTSFWNIYTVCTICYIVERGDSRSGFLDDSSTTGKTIRHINCHFLVRDSRSSTRCPACVAHRASLLVQAQRMHDAVLRETSHTAPSSHVNHRYRAYTNHLHIKITLIQISTNSSPDKPIESATSSK